MRCWNSVQPYVYVSSSNWRRTYSVGVGRFLLMKLSNTRVGLSLTMHRNLRNHHDNPNFLHQANWGEV